jgi:hypothetical protein
MMRTFRMQIAGMIAARLRPLLRLADWSCKFIALQGPIDRNHAVLVRKTRL